MTKIVVTGANGHMGRVIADIVGGREDCTIIAGIDLNTTPNGVFPIVEKPSMLPEKPDVIIDFSHPSALDGLLDYCISNHVPIVIATTGFNDEQKAKIQAASEKVAVFFSFNMSLGINLLCALAKTAARILGSEFDVEILEKHHHRKLDAPSGTALMLADAINSATDREYEYIYERHSVRQPRQPNEIGISSIRGGTIVGEHDIIFAGRDEVITLSHQAASREVFAVGAVNAGIFISDKQAGMYDMSAMIEQRI